MILRLNKPGDLQPSWWLNLIEHIFDNGWTSSDFYHNVNIECKKYGGEYIWIGIEFEKEEDMTFFILRWS
jgi:hypothetical protein